MALLALLVIPQVGKYTKKGEKSYYESLASELIVMAKNYYTDNKNELPRGQLSEDGHPTIYKVLTIDELKEGNYITNDIVDTKNNSCEASYVTVENNNGQFEYNACLICNGESVYGEDCPFGGTKDNSTPECTVELENYSIGNWTNKAVTAKITGTDESGIYSFVSDGKKSLAENNTGTIKFTKSGDYTIKVYDKAGNAGICKTGQINIDKVKPVCESAIIMPVEWAREKTMTVVSSDDVSGVAKIIVNGTAMNMLENVGTMKITKNDTYVATVYDNAGNSINCSDVIETKTDGVDPTVEIAKVPGKGSLKINGTLKDDIGVIKYQWTTTNEEPTEWIEISSTKKITVSKKVNVNGTYYLWAKDAMGNLGIGNTVVTSKRCCDSCKSCITHTEYEYTNVCDSYSCDCTTHYNSCPSNYTYCDNYGPNCCNAGRQYMNPGKYTTCASTCYRNCRDEVTGSHEVTDSCSYYECRCGTCFE